MSSYADWLPARRGNRWHRVDAEGHALCRQDIQLARHRPRTAPPVFCRNCLLYGDAPPKLYLVDGAEIDAKALEPPPVGDRTGEADARARHPSAWRREGKQLPAPRDDALNNPDGRRHD